MFIPCHSKKTKIKPYYSHAQGVALGIQLFENCIFYNRLGLRAKLEDDICSFRPQIRCLGFAPRSGSFAKEPTVQVCSIPSLSGIHYVHSVRKSASWILAVRKSVVLLTRTSFTSFHSCQNPLTKQFEC